MQRLILASALSMAVSASSCGLNSKGEDSALPVGVCVYEMSGDQAPLEVWGLTQARQGQSCFQGGVTKLFLPPERDASCDENVAPGKLIAFLKLDDATSEFLSCSALTRQSLPDAKSIYFVLPDDGSGLEEFSQFALDLRALVMGAALPATHFGSYGRIICLETPVPQKLAARIREAGVFVPDNVVLHTDGLSCENVSQETQGKDWPRFVIGDEALITRDLE